MGLEIAGIVRDMGAVAKAAGRFKPGDAVCALLGGGGYAQRVAVRHDMLLPIPQGLSLAEASSLPEACATSYLNLFIEGDLRAGPTRPTFPPGQADWPASPSPWPKPSARGSSPAC